MPIGQAARRDARRAQVSALFGDKTELALDLLEITDLACHDCYQEVAPPDEVLDDLIVLSGGTIDGLITASRLAVTDWRSPTGET